MIYLHDNKADILDKLEKRISQNNLHIDLLTKAFAGVEKVKHHKQVTKKLITAIDCHASLNTDFTMYLELYMEQGSRIWKSTPGTDCTGSNYSTSDYYEEGSTRVYFKTYEELLDNLRKRVGALEESNLQLLFEIKDIDKLIKQAKEIEKLYKAFDNSASYALRNALNFK